MKKTYLLLLILVIRFDPCLSQETQEDNLDFLTFYGTKVVFGGSGNWRHSHEIQYRTFNDAQSLDRYFYEVVAPYTPNKYVEIVPDLRVSITGNAGVEVRPGLGVVFKHYIGKPTLQKGQQFVHQVKVQTDHNSENKFKSAARYFLTYNNILNEKWIVSATTGSLVTFDDGTASPSLRLAGILTYRIDEQHTLSMMYGGFVNNMELEQKSYFHGILLQFIIRLNKDYKYLPAKYINF